MKSSTQTQSGKTIDLPSRMFKDKDLEEMEIDSVDNQIFFNKINYGDEFPTVDGIKSNAMPIVNYPDCSQTIFSKKKLVEVVEKQFAQNGDFIVIPYFKNETQFDVSDKLSFVETLRKNNDLKKDIIFEISYKIDDTIMDMVISKSKVFDYLSIFYGVHFGRHQSFSMICEKILNFKINTGKKVFCTAVPLMFAVGSKNPIEAHLLPIWDLVCDGWVKNWKKGGSKGDIKLVDFADMKNKTMLEWLKPGHHQSGENVKYVDQNIYSLFQPGKQGEILRATYTKMLLDEAINEAHSLTPSTVEAYLTRCPLLYVHLLIRTYTEKMIQVKIREAKWKNFYTPQEMQLVENHLRSTFPFSIKDLDGKLQNISQLAEIKVPITILINEIDKI